MAILNLAALLLLPSIFIKDLISYEGHTIPGLFFTDLRKFQCLLVTAAYLIMQVKQFDCIQ